MSCFLLLFLSFLLLRFIFLFFFFNDTATTEIYTLSLHDALPIYDVVRLATALPPARIVVVLRDLVEAELLIVIGRSEEHTSELQSRFDLVCRLLLEKKKQKKIKTLKIKIN